MNGPYFHVLAGLGFSFLQFGHLAITTTDSVFVRIGLKRFIACLGCLWFSG